MKGNSNSKKTTEEKKNEKKMTNTDLMQFLGKYDSILKDKMISDNAKKVLSCLLYVGSKQNESFTIGQRTISELTGVAKNKISANIAILVDKGFINCNVGERGKNSEYTINYETMKSYVSISVPSVPKCTGKVSQVSQVSQSVPSVPNNEGTVKRTVEGTPKDAEIQRVMERIEVYQKCINEELGTLKKMLFGDINININNNINLKDNILNNDNTEEYNTRDQEKKKNISTVNLEKLKENSKDENSNEEDIQRENESLNEIENTSKDKLLDNENLNESRIPSDEGNISDNENPNDMPPLDVDCFFEDSNSTEYRTNENLNESRIPSEDGRIETRDNISDNENSKADEIDCSVFGNETFDSDTISKTQNLVPRCVDGRFVVVEDNSKANNISNDNNLNSSENMKKTKISKEKSQTIENVKTVKGEISNGLNSSKENENFNVFGKLQSFRDLKTGQIDGYQFNSYDNLNDSRDYSKSFHASVLCLNLEPSDLKASVSDTGTWGILSRKDGVYSFTASNVGPSYAPNNALQGDETSEVDNHTAKGEKIDSTQSQIANKESEGNTNTTSDNKKDEKATEMPNADEKNAEVDNHTTDEEKTAGNSVKMRPEPSDSNTNTEKVDSTQSQNANKASNEYADDLEDDAETIAIRERVMRQNAARAQQTEKKSDDNAPKVLDYYKRTPDGWKEIPVHITMENKKMTMGEALELYKNFDNPLKYIYSIMRYVQDFCDKMKCALRLKAITDEQFNAFKNELNYISERYKAYWRKRFSYQEPDPNSSAEKDMHRWLGSPKVTQGKN